mmetsp:Transcript_19806/g.45184  ORF Transcript_19806/g.45184 Transcript_19806/m.45184 type:complete len:153 (+) Transcript_19806:92-550(+)
MCKCKCGRNILIEDIPPRVWDWFGVSIRYNRTKESNTTDRNESASGDERNKSEPNRIERGSRRGESRTSEKRNSVRRHNRCQRSIPPPVVTFCDREEWFHTKHTIPPSAIPLDPKQRIVVFPFLTVAKGKQPRRTKSFFVCGNACCFVLCCS